MRPRCPREAQGVLRRIVVLRRWSNLGFLGRMECIREMMMIGRMKIKRDMMTLN